MATTQSSQKISDEELKTDLERVIDKLGQLPLSTEYTTHGQFSTRTIGRRFGNGSWVTALDTLGYDTSTRKFREVTGRPKIAEEDIKQDIKAVANSLGHPPTTTEYDTHGKYSLTTYYQTLSETWENTLNSLGYNYKARNGEDTEKRLRQDFDATTRALGHPPTKAEYDEFGVYTTYSQISHTTPDDSSTWKEVIKYYGYTISQRHRVSIPTSDVIDDIKRVDELLENTPSTTDYKKHGNYSLVAVKRNFDQNTWTEILKEINVFEPDDHPYAP